MRVNGLDRIVFMVRDMDKSLDLFSNMLGMKFLELDEEVSKRDGFRSYICPDINLHIFSPILPIRSNIPLLMRKKLDLLKEYEAVFMALTFMVDDTEKTRIELASCGIDSWYEYNGTRDYASIGLDNLAEIVTSPESTIGIPLGFAAFSRNTELENEYSGKNTCNVHTERWTKVGELDRVVFMVKDINMALNLFSNKLGMKFEELSKEVQERDCIIGYVCHDLHVQLVQPLLPLPEYAPLPVKRGVDMLSNNDPIMLTLVLKVDDPLSVSAELQKAGIDTLYTRKESSDKASVGMGQVVEAFTDPEKTMGIQLCFSK